MHYTFNTDRTRLTVHADADERAALAEARTDNPEEWGGSPIEADTLEHLLCNSELDWVNPTDTGDLTDAPMIGITDEDGTVLERWAFMDYQLRTFCDDLIERGEAVFIGGH